MSPHSRSILQLHAAVLLFGLAGLFGKWLDLPPVVIVFGRVVFATLALLVAAALWKLPAWPRSGRSLLAFPALGVLLALHWTAFFQSVQEAGVAVALISYSTFPVFVVFLEPLLLPERLRPADVALAAVAALGIAVLAPGFSADEGTTWGVLWGVLSGLTFALLSVLNRRFVRQHASITIALGQDAFAALALVPVVVPRWPGLGTRDVLLLLVLGVLCTAVAHSLFIAGLHGSRARTAGMISCLEPVYGAALAALLLGEVPGVRTLVGGALVVGVAFVATVSPGRIAVEPELSGPSRARE
jgi:drug/metabolite transporter (DMT)-like permease